VVNSHRLDAVLAASLVATLVAASPAHAQITLGLGGGVSFPTSDLKTAYTTGYNALANLEFHVPAVPIGIRGDVMFNHFPLKSGLAAGGHTQVWTVNANGVLSAPGMTVFTPYLIAGVGYYNSSYRVNVSGTSFSGGGSTTKNNVGINGGGGAKLSLPGTGIGFFAEIRYHYIFASGSHPQFVPITAGVTF
jgi:hypothetical protein